MIEASRVGSGRPRSNPHLMRGAFMTLAFVLLAITVPLHDAKGSLVRNERGYGFTYDFENRLTRAFTDSDLDGQYDPGEPIHAEYVVDPLGRRVRATVGGVTTYRYYDGPVVLAEFDAGAPATPVACYFNGPNYLDEKLLIRGGAGTGGSAEFYVLLKDLYTVAGLTDADGRLLEWYTYSGYGLPSITTVGGGPGLPPLGDADGDGDIDLIDFAAFQACYRGPGVPYASGCEIFDADLDGDVDGHDLGVFLVLLDGRADFDRDLDIDGADWTRFAACLGGPGVPASGGCQPGDLDADGDVDLADAATFQAVFTSPRGGGPGAIPANAYCFTGRRLDFDRRDADGSVTGQVGRPLLVLYDYRARAYDPFHGRFCQRDAALYAESLNLYQYGLSNPQGRLDPSGRQSEIDSLILDLVAHRIVTMEYIAAGARLAQMGMQASLVMMELYISFKSPFAGALLSGYRFAENPSWLGAADVAASVAGLGPLDELGGYVLRWQARYARLANRGGQAVKESLKRNLHHALPQFLGGLPGQTLSDIPKSAHDFFHAALRDELVKAGFPASMMGGPGGSAKAWEAYFKRNPGSQFAAFEAVQRASEYTDTTFGTSLLDDVLRRIAEGAFVQY